MNIQPPLLLLTLLFLTLTPGPAHACEISPTEKARLFSQFDKNGDGKLSRDEYVYSEMRRLGKKGSAEMKLLDQRFQEMAPKGSLTPDTFTPVSTTRCQ